MQFTLNQLLAAVAFVALSAWLASVNWVFGFLLLWAAAIWILMVQGYVRLALLLPLLIMLSVSYLDVCNMSFGVMKAPGDRKGRLS